MQITLTEEGYTLDGKWKLVPVSATKEMQIAWDRDVLDTGFSYSAYNEILDVSPKPEFPRQEFKAIFFCRQCGTDAVGNHLPSCPTLKSKL